MRIAVAFSSNGSTLMTEPTDRIFYQWRVLERGAKGRERSRLLRWRMTQADAQKWVESNMKVLEVVPGSGEKRGVLYAE